MNILGKVNVKNSEVADFYNATKKLSDFVGKQIIIKKLFIYENAGQKVGVIGDSTNNVIATTSINVIGLLELLSIMQDSYDFTKGVKVEVKTEKSANDNDFMVLRFCK